MEITYSWWSIISTILGIIFLLGNVVQFISNKKEKEIHKSQVKIWQHHAAGINHGLYYLIAKDRFSSVADIQQAIMAIQPSTYSLFQSLNEERLFSEQEIKEKQLAREKANEELIESIKRPNKSATPEVPQ